VSSSDRTNCVRQPELRWLVGSRFGDAAHQGGTDDQTVGHGASARTCLAADAEADTNRQGGLLPEPGDVVVELWRQFSAFARDAGERYVVQEPVEDGRCARRDPAASSA